MSAFFAPIPTAAEVDDNARRRWWHRYLLAAAVVWALIIGSQAGVNELRIAGASPASASAFVDHCHSSPEAHDWCRFLIWIETPGARDYFEWMTAPKVAAATWSVWDELRLCEAPDWAGGWQANTGNGYYGGLQFSLTSWRGVGGTGYPHQHSRETQIVMGERLLAAQGWGAWPTCSRKLGLR